MVRINLINPKYLSDQHLIAEYNEILMLLGYVRKYPENLDVPKTYALGKGHIKFFKNKLLYLEKRHELIKAEMKLRGFKTNKKVDFRGINKELLGDWQPLKSDLDIIKKRLEFKLRNKKDWHRYYGEKKQEKFFIELLNRA